MSALSLLSDKQTTKNPVPFNRHGVYSLLSAVKIFNHADKLFCRRKMIV